MREAQAACTTARAATCTGAASDAKTGAEAGAEAGAGGADGAGADSDAAAEAAWPAACHCSGVREDVLARTLACSGRCREVPSRRGGQGLAVSRPPRG